MISSKHPLGFVEDVYLDFFYILQSWSIILFFLVQIFLKRGTMFFKKDHGIILAIILAIIGQSWLHLPREVPREPSARWFFGPCAWQRGDLARPSASRGGEFSFAKGWATGYLVISGQISGSLTRVLGPQMVEFSKRKITDKFQGNHGTSRLVKYYDLARVYNTNPNNALLLMVQKSHSQPPGMVLKPFKYWGV